MVVIPSLPPNMTENKKQNYTYYYRPNQEDKSTKKKKIRKTYQEVLSSGLEVLPPSFALPFILL